MIKASTNKGKKDKKKAKKGAMESPPPEDPEEAAEAAEAKKPVEVTAEDLADEEWGPVKGKKGKKDKGKKGKNDDEVVEEARQGVLPILCNRVQIVHPNLPLASPAPATPIEKADSQGAEQDEEAEGTGPKLLSKKEKERLKKEREKVSGTIFNVSDNDLNWSARVG